MAPAVLLFGGELVEGDGLGEPVHRQQPGFGATGGVVRGRGVGAGCSDQRVPLQGRHGLVEPQRRPDKCGELGG